MLTTFFSNIRTIQRPGIDKNVCHSRATQRSVLSRYLKKLMITALLIFSQLRDPVLMIRQCTS